MIIGFIIGALVVLVFVLANAFNESNTNLKHSRHRILNLEETLKAYEKEFEERFDDQ